MYTFSVCIQSVCECVRDFMLYPFECYFTPPPLMCPVREQQHGSLTCHIVAWHCLMIRECRRHSTALGWSSAVEVPQNCHKFVSGCGRGCHRLMFFFLTLIWSFSLPALSPPPTLFFHLSGLTLCPLLSPTKWIHAFIHCIQSQKRLRHKLMHAGLSSCFSWSFQP